MEKIRVLLKSERIIYMSINSMTNREEIYSIFPQPVNQAKVSDYFSGKEYIKNKDTEKISSNSIFLCFTNRCGSTLIGSVLSSCGVFGKPNSHLNYEYFNYDEVIEFSRANNVNSFDEYVGRVIREFSILPDIFSSKLGIDQLVWLSKNNFIGGRLQNPIFIYSTRRNIVAQAISLSIAHQTKKWTSLHPETDIVPIYNAKEIREHMLTIVRINTMFELYFMLRDIDPIRIVYEDIVENVGSIISRTAQALGQELRFEGEKTLDLKRQASDLNIEWEKRFRADYVVGCK